MNGPSNIFFSTSSILEWKPLLSNDYYKDILIQSLQTLTKLNRLVVYTFVIMPNHIHIIWAENDSDGSKESAQASFFKFTAHQFLKKLKKENETQLKNFQVNSADRKYQFWQRNTLDIEILSDNMFEQKLNYIHNNPLQQHWQLVDNPVKYKYSSASYYERNIDEFGILTDYYLA